MRGGEIVFHTATYVTSGLLLAKVLSSALQPSTPDATVLRVFRNRLKQLTS